MNTVEMAHGSGGQAMQQLINQLFMEAFNNSPLAEQEDQARIALSTLTAHGDRLAFSTDSYVIDPLFFPGGDIGKLAVCGTANDVAVSGAIPVTSPAGLSSKKGYRWRRSRRWSTAWRTPPARRGSPSSPGIPRWCSAARRISSSSTPPGWGDPADIHWGAQQLCAGDVLIVSGTLGCHGATILNLREGLGLDGELRSDCAVLTPLIQTLRDMPGVKPCATPHGAA